MDRYIRLVSLLAVGSVLLTGCARMSGATQSLTAHKGPSKNSGSQRISRIVCLWEPAEGVGPDGRPNRGFLGQVLFFEPGSDQPVLVDGKIDIYTFDDQGTPEEQARPLKKFSYTSAEWNQLATDSALGTAYNVAIPHARKAQYETVCALRVKFTSPNGEVAYSGLDSVTLRGKGNPNGLSMKRTRSKLSAHELLKEQFGDLGGKQPTTPQSKVEIGDTTIERTSKSENSLETLTIRRPQARNSRSRTSRRPGGSKARTRLGSMDSAASADQVSEHDFAGSTP